MIAVAALALAASAADAQLRTRRDYSRAPAITRNPVLDTIAPVQVRALVLPETVYVGQQATYQVAAFFARSVRDRVRPVLLDLIHDPMFRSQVAALNALGELGDEALGCLARVLASATGRRRASVPTRWWAAFTRASRTPSRGSSPSR